MLVKSPLYPTPTIDEAKKHILALLPPHKRNEVLGLLQTLQNSIINQVKK